MTPTELLIDPTIGDNGTVETHARYPGNRFTVTELRTFPTPEDARQWSLEQIRRGARWVRTDYRLGYTVPPLPDIRAWHPRPGAITLQIDGRTIVADETSPRRLRRALPESLLARPCSVCERYPRIKLVEGTLIHQEGDCGIQVGMRSPRIPVALMIYAWNSYFSGRRHPLTLDPVTLPHLAELAIIRDPTEAEMVARIRKVEVL